MDKDALVKILKHARESGIRTGVLKGAPGRAMERMYAVWKTETDKKIYEGLIRILNRSSDLNDFNDKM